MRWLGLVPAWSTLTALASPFLPPVGKIIILIVAAASAWAPGEGFLLVAGLAPLGALVATVFDLGPFRFTEAMILAFFAGWLLRGPAFRAEGPRLPAYAVRAAWLFAGLAAASAAGLAWRFSHGPSAGATPWMAALWTRYYVTQDPAGIVEGAKLVEGLALVTATISLLRERPSLAVEIPAALVVSAACAAASSVFLWTGIGPTSLLDRYARLGYRVAAHVSDVNAAGSYFVLILGLAIGMGLRDRGTSRILWLGGAAASAIGVWLSRSQSAWAAAVGVVAAIALWNWALRWRPAVRAMALVALLLVLGGLGALRAVQLQRNPEYRGTGLRQQFAATSFRMIKARPVFGLGIGRYYPDSALFMGPELAWTYGHENGHNNFLQIAAESGLFGFALLAIFVAGGLLVAGRALGRVRRDWRLAGGCAGAAGFLATCLTGDLLLVPEVAAPFWVQLGLVAALGSSTLLTLREPPTPDVWPARWTAPVIAAAIIAVVASVPARTTGAPLAPPASHDVDGLYDPEVGNDGVTARWTRHYASLFAPAGARRIEIPVRALEGDGTGKPKTLEIRVAGRALGEFDVQGSWTTIALSLPDSQAAPGIERIDLMVGRGWRDAQAGLGDYRQGVEIGEPRFLPR